VRRPSSKYPLELRVDADAPHLALLLVPAVAVLAAAHAASGADDGSMHVVFPERFSVRQMTDRVAEVRGIAIRRRHVTPRLTGRAYSKAAAQARAPRGFPRRPRRIEGFVHHFFTADEQEFCRKAAEYGYSY